MRVEHVGEVALGAGLPMGGRLHVEADVWELGSERRRNQKRVLLGIREKLLGQAIFLVSAVDGERGHAWTGPRDAVLAVAGVVDRGSSTSGREEAQLM